MKFKCVFHFDFIKWDDDSTIVEVIILAITILWIFGFNLIVCESGQRVTDQFDLFGLEFGRCDWNELSVEMQRMYLIFLSDTQQQKNLRSYAGIMCTRDTFKTVRDINEIHNKYVSRVTDRF